MNKTIFLIAIVVLLSSCVPADTTEVCGERSHCVADVNATAPAEGRPTCIRIDRREEFPHTPICYCDACPVGVID